MKRKTKIFWVTWILIIVTLALIVTLNQNFLVSFINQYIESYGLPSVFLLSMLTDSFDQPIGPEVPAGFAVGFGLNPLYVLIFSIFGSLIASTFHFYLGRIYFSKKIKESCSDEQHRNLYRFFEKYGKFVLLVGALTPVPYVASIWTAGSFKVRTWEFFVLGPMARAFRIGLIALGVSLIF